MIICVYLKRQMEALHCFPQEQRFWLSTVSMLESLVFQRKKFKHRRAEALSKEVPHQHQSFDENLPLLVVTHCIPMFLFGLLYFKEPY